MRWSPRPTRGELVQEHSPNGGLLERVARAEARVRLCAGDAVRAERLLATLPAVPDVLLLRIRLGLLRGTPVARQMVREMEPTTPKEEVELAILSAWAQLDHSRARAEQDLLRAAELAVAHGMSTPLVGVPTACCGWPGRRPSTSSTTPCCGWSRSPRPRRPNRESPDDSAGDRARRRGAEPR